MSFTGPEQVAHEMRTKVLPRLKESALRLQLCECQLSRKLREMAENKEYESHLKFIRMFADRQEAFAASIESLLEQVEEQS